MFCVKEATMSLLFDNPFTSFGPPSPVAAAAHSGAVLSRILFVPGKLF